MDVYSNDYIKNDIPFQIGSADINELSRFSLKCDDVIITKDSESPDDIAIPAVISELIDHLVCGYHLAILRPDQSQIYGIFLMHKLKLPEVKTHFFQVANGSTRYGLTIGDIENVQISIPSSLSEQRKIARILSTVDAVIEKSEAAIAKYKAIKSGMMRDLFTRGIDLKTGKLRPRYEDAPELYKQSELGWVPKEWEVMKIGELASMKSGEGITSNSIFDYAQYPVYGGNGLRGFTTAYTHDGHYVLIGRQGALCGNVNRVMGKFYASEHAVVVSVFYQISVDWLSQLLAVMNLNQYSEASAQPGLAVSKILSLIVKKPQFNEQKEIAKHLLSIDSKAQIENKILCKYQQLKFALMSDLLTGKVRVKYEEETAETQ